MTEKSKELTATKFIRGKRDRVFTAWISPKMAKNWFCPENFKVTSFESNPKVGGDYRYVMEGPAGVFPTSGVYKDVVTNQKLVFTWGKDGYDRADHNEAEITVDFSDDNGGTMVTLTHRHPVAEDLATYKDGWDSALRNLSKYFASL
ncbi:MAG: SRPBCC domain-containing protein [Bdellovibrionaceae bacterium]|nr:SRPBCC domain-containing protein [Pseudobdellovibrionaceae bacterium]